MQYRSCTETGGLCHSIDGGFTLLELLVVLVIAASIVTLALPQFSNAMTVVELKNDTRKLASTLRHARSQAIARRQEVAVILDVQQRTYRTSGLKDIHRLSSALNLKLLTAESELSSDKVGAVRFFADGSSTGGRITLAANGHAYFVDVNWLTGTVVIHD
ncbi:MAG: GspH/FimT family protein [Gammaproteobacteria bacterium]|nr:GspH/FimT family protein [Gammaproteobacteria bacterium]